MSRLEVKIDIVKHQTMIKKKIRMEYAKPLGYH
jgi:hypothetical protein